MTAIPLVHCPVCAVELGGPIEICTTCQTPHHGDCARFVGRCAMAGCGAYEFMAIDPVEAGFPPAPPKGEATASAEKPSAQVPVAVARPSSSVTVPRAPMAAIGRRLGASVVLLARNPGITVPVGLLMLVASVIPLVLTGKAWMLAQLGLLFGWMIGQAMTVIMLSARAQGKHQSIGSALALAAERGGRVIGTSLASGAISVLPLIAGLGLAMSGMMMFNPWMIGAGSLLTLFGFKKFVGYSLVPIVAAMGEEAEPRNALIRSTELVSTARTQAALSVVGVMIASVVAPALPLLISLLFNEALALVTTAYWVLFYLEARRERPE